MRQKTLGRKAGAIEGAVTRKPGRAATIIAAAGVLFVMFWIVGETPERWAVD
jgi:hypothetical protein